jgi:hypothetical protein
LPATSSIGEAPRKHASREHDINTTQSQSGGDGVPIRTAEHFDNDGKPKRILALDGGGLRGILTLSYLAGIEALLRARHGGSQDFRLSHFSI